MKKKKKESKSLEPKIDFVTLASHALRTPLSATKWYLEVLRKEKIGRLNIRQRDFLAEANRANERMIKIINDLLFVTRIQEQRLDPVLRPVQLAEVIQDVVKGVSAFVSGTRKKTIYNYCYARNIPFIMADRDLMKHVLRNLLMNAIEYTPSGGGVVTIGCERKNHEVVYSVTDTGVGISRKDQKNIFKKFFRAKSVLQMVTQGLGLGLFIAKSIIIAHGGKIWFQSEEGRGSTFYFSLPVSADIRGKHRRTALKT